MYDCLCAWLMCVWLVVCMNGCVYDWLCAWLVMRVFDVCVIGCVYEWLCAWLVMRVIDVCVIGCVYEWLCAWLVMCMIGYVHDWLCACLMYVWFVVCTNGCVHDWLCACFVICMVGLEWVTTLSLTDDSIPYPWQQLLMQNNSDAHNLSLGRWFDGCFKSREGTVGEGVFVSYMYAAKNTCTQYNSRTIYV